MKKKADARKERNTKLVTSYGIDVGRCDDRLGGWLMKEVIKQVIPFNSVKEKITEIDNENGELKRKLKEAREEYRVLKVKHDRLVEAARLVISNAGHLDQCNAGYSGVEEDCNCELKILKFAIKEAVDNKNERDKR